MNYQFMYAGSMGIPMFYEHIVAYVIDHLQGDPQERTILMGILEDFCTAYAQKIINFSRVSVLTCQAVEYVAKTYQSLDKRSKAAKE